VRMVSLPFKLGLREEPLLLMGFTARRAAA
jgi:hypothetical protein